MATTVSDEEIIAALMNFGTRKEAAHALGIAERTIYDRMTNREFKEKYKSAKADVVRKAVFEINRQLGAAVNTIVEIMNDRCVSPGLRLQAAQLILRNASHFSERLNEDEKTLIEQQRSRINSFKL